MEDDTGPVVVLHGLHETDVEEHRPVERVLISLVEHIDAIVELLYPGRCMIHKCLLAPSGALVVIMVY